MKQLGLRLDVLAKDDIYYVLFYDIDGDITGEQDALLDNIMYLHQISYILFKTKHGYHLIGLTPLNIIQHASAFHSLKKIFNSYYGGIIVRLSRKKDEVQTLVRVQESYGEVIPNLFNLYASRFGLEKKPWTREFAKYILQFEKYRSKKE